MADVESDIQECTKVVDFSDLENVVDLPDNNALAAFCPPMLIFFECLEGVVLDHTGFTVLELQNFMQGTEVERFIAVYVNTKNVIIELCDEDSRLNKDYRQNSQCFKTVGTADDSEICQRQAVAAYETYKEFEDNVQEEAGESTYNDKQQCMIEAYQKACIGAKIHEVCGRQAFDTYMEVIRRTTVFRNAICTENQLEIAKTKFVDSLQMDSLQKELYRLAFDLKKRKK